MVNENGYDINEAGDAKPWGGLDEANFKLLFSMMPTRGTFLVDTVTVPTPHKHSRLFDENEAQQAEMTSTAFNINMRSVFRQTAGVALPALNAGTTGVFRGDVDCYVSAISLGGISGFNMGTTVSERYASVYYDSNTWVSHYTSRTNGAANTDRMTLADTETVVNDPGGDVDTRIESVGSTHAFFVDAANSRSMAIKTTATFAALPALATGTVFVVARNDNDEPAGLSIIGHTGGWSRICFGDTNDEDVGQISYAHGSGFSVVVETATILSMMTTGLLMNHRFQGKQGADIASANDITLTSGNYFDITGAVQINRILTTNWQAGSMITLKFDGAPTVSHNTAAGGGYAGILLSGAVNFVASANDTLTLVYDGTYWREIARTII